MTHCHANVHPSAPNRNLGNNRRMAVSANLFECPCVIAQVLPRKGICTVLYCTEEQEDLDLHEILEAKHLRIVTHP